MRPEDSPFLHLIELQNGAALFHALTQQVVYGPYKLLRRRVPKEFETALPTSAEEEDILRGWRRDCAAGGVSMATMYLTTACPHSCGYCFLAGTELRAESMTKEEISRALRTLEETADTAGADLLLYGGEPFLRPDLIEHALERAAATPAVKGIIAITAGHGADSELAAKLAARDVFMIVSMDGPPEVHDRCRPLGGGRSSFELARRAFHVYREAGCRVGISVTLTSGNLEAMPKGFVWLIDTFDPDDIGLNSALHPDMKGRLPECQVPAARATRVMLQCLELARQRRVYVEQLFRRLRPFALSRPRLRDCPAAGARLVFAPGERMGFCDCLTLRGVGVTGARSSDAPGDLHLDELKRCCPVFWDHCLSCPSLSICGGGCRYDAWCASGSLSGRSPYRCEQERLLLRWLLTDLRDSCGFEAGDTRILIPSREERLAMLGGIDPLDNRVVPMPRGTLCGEPRT